jgi:hypothetical protein
MTSPRKKYQHIESDKDGPPVATAPLEAAAKPPEPVADADKQPVEMPATESDAVREAEKVALRQRLAEMDRASTIVQHAMTERQHMATEPQPRQAPEVPAQVREWLEANPHYLNDPIHAAELQLATLRSVRDGKSWSDSDFIETIERHLGNGHVHESRQPSAAPRNTVQQRPVVQRQGAPVSAPPTREALSMSTGRPTNEPTRLTVEEVQLARSLGISEDEYKAQKAKMNRLKAAGAIQSGQQ